MTKREDLPRSDAEWQEILSPEQYRVCRQKGTEAPFSGEYVHCDDSGVYRCVCCGDELFRSDTKFDAGCGWPSFFEALDATRIREESDASHGMVRTEVLCAGCGAHLGHVFPDGPQPTGLRYCINSVAIDLERGSGGGAEDLPDPGQ